MNQINIENLIIGAGPAGLATAGRLRKLNIPFEILEKTDKIAWAWHQHYDRLHLHTVKQLSELPHFSFPEDYPTYVPRLDLIRYFEDYVRHFDINPHFHEEVISIKKKGGNHCVETKSGKSFLAKNVIIATGKNRRPNIPTWARQENLKGKIIHSLFYKNPKPFKNQKVLVVGMGNTGAEVALDLSEHGVETYISVRGEIALVPRDLNGRPVQLTAKKLAKIPFGLGDWLGSQIRKIYFGNLEKYGLRISKMHPAVMLRETGKTPVIDIGTVAQIKAGKIKILPDIKHFYETGVEFENGERHDFDIILLATGFHADLHDFIENTENLFDKCNLPKSPIGAQEGLYFVGFDNYKLGGILGTIFNDSETVVRAISAGQILG